MKNSTIILLILLSLAAGGCKDDAPSLPDPDFPSISSGAYILTQGNYYDNIEGTLNVIDYSSGTMEANLFTRANGRSLGNTPQCGLAYGSKIYLGVRYSQTIEILDRNTYKSLKQIRLSDAAKGTQPSSMVAKGGYVYVAMFDGYVARLDTVAMEMDRSVKVGPNPEIMCLHGNRLFVPNSDGMNWASGVYGKTASVVNVPDLTLERTITVPENPDKFVSAAGRLFLLSKGNYADVAAGVYEVKSDYSIVKIADASSLDAFGTSLYMFDIPWIYDAATGASTYTVDYRRYDLSANRLTEWNFDKSQIKYPSGMGVDPVSGKMIVTSYNLNGSYPDYNGAAYAAEFTPDGKFVRSYPIGAGTPCIFFNNK